MAVDLTNREFVAKLVESNRSEKGRMHWILMPLVLLMAVYLTPIYYLTVTVFKTTEEYARNDVFALPESLAPFIDNVVKAWTAANLSSAAFNSFTYALFGSALAISIAAAAAYGMTRLKLVGANGWFMLIFAGTLFPFQMYLIPMLFGYQKLGLINSWFGMLAVYTALNIPFPLLVLRNSFSAISREIDEAARMEGASELRVFISMIVPNAKGSLMALFLLQFTGIWNDLLFSSILANGNNVRSIAVALQALQGVYAATGPNVVVTAALITSIPTVLLFIAFRKRFMVGLALTTH